MFRCFDYQKEVCVPRSKPISDLSYKMVSLMNSIVFLGVFIGFLVSPVLCIQDSRYSSSPGKITSLPPIIGKWLENELYYRVSNEKFQPGSETSVAVRQ